MASGFVPTMLFVPYFLVQVSSLPLWQSGIVMAIGPLGMMIAGAGLGVSGLTAHLALKQWKAFARAAAETPTLANDHEAADEDTLLVMPDISGYGQFLSSATSAEAARADESASVTAAT